MADVFISYKRQERDAVERIARALRELGLSVWFDAALEGGASFHDEIEREVRSAKAVLVCWTPAARTSPWVMGEAQIGFDRRVLLPIFLEPTQLPPPFNTAHAVSLTGWHGAHDDLNWLNIVERLASLVQRPGLKFVAQALAAGEPIQVFGANEAEQAGRPEARARRSPPRRNLKQSTPARMSEHAASKWGTFGALLIKVVGVLVTGPIILILQRRWRLLAFWFLSVVAGSLGSYAYFVNDGEYGIDWILATSGGQGLYVGNVGAGAILFLLEISKAFQARR